MKILKYVTQEYILADNDPVQGRIELKRIAEDHLEQKEARLEQIVLSFTREMRSFKVRMRKVFPKQFFFDKDFAEETVQRNERDAIVATQATLYEYIYEIKERQRTYKVLAALGHNAVQTAQLYLGRLAAAMAEYQVAQANYRVTQQLDVRLCRCRG